MPSRDDEHRHDHSCKERATFTNCGKDVHTHLANWCYDEHGRVTCRRPTDHPRHETSCYPILYTCGYEP